MTTTTTTTPATTAPLAKMWTTSRIVALVFTVLEVLLLVRFTFRLLGANAEQGFVSVVYAITEPLVAPFRGIFAQQDGTSGDAIATLLSVTFLVLVAALILAIVRAYSGRQGEHDASAPTA